MDFDQFKADALKTESRVTGEGVDLDDLYNLLVTATLAANLVDLYKKNIFYGKEVKTDTALSLLVKLSVSTNIGIDDLMRRETQGEPVEPAEVSQPNMRLLHAALGMFTESAELLFAIRKQMLTGKPLDLVNFGEELGDSDWYKAIAHDELGISEERVRNAVIAKLQKRYPGKFDADAAINRDLKSERSTLEESLSQ